MSALARVDPHTDLVTAQTDEWVGLSSRSTPGWPWPEDSYGMSPLYGEHGWCRGCGTPFAEQAGYLVIQGHGFPKSDVWMPNWLFDVVCVSASLADEIRRTFQVTLREVHKPRTGPTGAQQLIPARTPRTWYRPQDLEQAIQSRHAKTSGAKTGATCRKCGRWKWLPSWVGETPIAPTTFSAGADLVASPESFGDGLKSFHHLLFRRALGELLVAANPKHWSLVEVAQL